MKRRSKRYQENSKLVDHDKLYKLEEAVAILKRFKTRPTETVRLVVQLGIDTKRSEQSVRGSFSLPKGIGKSKRVVVFAEGAKAQEATAAGAEAVGSADLAQRILEGWLDFDVVVAAPDQMKHVGKLGKVLGPQGLMPSPKTGTVTQDIGRVVTEYKAGKIEFRSDKEGGNVHVVVGQAAFSAEELIANVTAFVTHLSTLKPSGAKGEFLKGASLSSTQSPGIKLSL